jgi:hypothetical protein
MRRIIQFLTNSLNGEESPRKVFIYGYVVPHIFLFIVDLALNISVALYLNLYSSYETYVHTIQWKTIFVFYEFINYLSYLWISICLWRCSKNTNSSFGRKLSKFGSVLSGLIFIGFPHFLFRLFTAKEISNNLMFN